MNLKLFLYSRLLEQLVKAVWLSDQGRWVCITGWFQVQAVHPTTHWICSRLPRVQLFGCTLHVADWSASCHLRSESLLKTSRKESMSLPSWWLYNIAWLINHASITVTQKRVFNLGKVEKYLAQDKLIATFSNIGLKSKINSSLLSFLDRIKFSFCFQLQANSSKLEKNSNYVRSPFTFTDTLFGVLALC